MNTVEQPQRQSLLLPSIILSTAILFAAVLVVTFNRPGGGGDDPVPLKNVEQAFDAAATEFFGGLGKEIEQIGQQVARGEITTVAQWREAGQAAFTRKDDAFVDITGKLDNQYVPNLDKPDEPLTTEQAKSLAAYTIASGRGLQEAVK